MKVTKIMSAVAVSTVLLSINCVSAQEIRQIALSPALSNTTSIPTVQPVQTAQPVQTTKVYGVSKNGVQTIIIQPTQPRVYTEPSKLPEKANPTTAQTKLEPYYTNWSTIEAYNKVNEIGMRLLDANGIRQNPKFSVTNTNDVNATTDINHDIKVYKGLLKYVEQEDELAAVIGHELGHVIHTDVAQKYVRYYAKAGVNTAAKLMATYGNSSTVRTIGKIATYGTDIGGDMINNKVDRNDEYAADKASVDLLVKAGYNPLAEISILNKICGNYFDLMSDHPSGEKRITAIYLYINQKYPEYIEQGYPTVSYKRALRIINNTIAYK